MSKITCCYKKKKSIFDIFGDNSAVALWTFDNTLDDAGGNYNLSVNTGSNSFGPGKINNCNNSSNVELYTPQNSSLFSSADYTISFWINGHQNMAYSDYPGIIAQGPDVGFGLVCYIYSSNLDICISDYDGHGIATGAVVVENEWHHIIISSTASASGEIYVDGQHINTLGSLATNNDTNNNIGRSSIKSYRNNAVGQWPLEADLDQLRVFNRPITASEALTLYNER
jgi:hypothetical protein